MVRKKNPDSGTGFVMNSMHPWLNHPSLSRLIYKVKTMALMSSTVLFTFNLLSSRCNFSPYIDLYIAVIWA